jgi:phenylacetate-CoA ligase
MTDDRPGIARRLLNSARVAALAWHERKVPFLPAERIERLQRRRIRAIIRHAYETVPFYRRAMNEARLRPGDFRTARDLERLPLLDDVVVRRNPEEFLSSAYQGRPLVSLETSGAHSRVRKSIQRDHAAALRGLASAERDRAVINRLLGRGWGQVRLFLLPPASATLTMRKFWDSQTVTPRGLAERHVFSTEHPFEEAAEEIRRIRPHVVFSYGSYTDEFFRFIHDRNIAIPSPRVWMYGGDGLAEHRRQWITETYGCVVYTTYQAVETGKIGFQCERLGGFHLNVDLCAVRVVDSSGGTVGPGLTGEIVVSNLINGAMVLLNFRLGDMGVLSAHACPCGRSLPVLERLEGRVNEILTAPDGRRVSVGVMETHLMDELDAAFQAQVTQPDPSRVLWSVVPLPNTDRDSLRRQMIEKTCGLFGAETDVEVAFVETIPHTPTGKFLRVISLAATDTGSSDGGPQ